MNKKQIIYSITGIFLASAALYIAKDLPSIPCEKRKNERVIYGLGFGTSGTLSAKCDR